MAVPSPPAAAAAAANIAIIGASGKLGGSTLDALLAHDMHPASQIFAMTSSQPGSETWEKLIRSSSSSSSSSPFSSSSSSSPPEKKIQVRHFSFDNDSKTSGAARAAAFQGIDVLFLVSTPKISLDFNDAPHGEGREAHHFAAIDAAVAAGVKVIVYSSLAFAFSSRGSSGDGAGAGAALVGDQSKAGVMRAHLRTEAYLHELASQGKIKTTIIREGLYNESWPLYMGYFDVPGYMSMVNKADGRQDETVVKLAGDGKISWTSIRDLGIGNAIVLSSLARDIAHAGSSDGSKYKKTDLANEYLGKTFYLSTPASQAITMVDLAELITRTASSMAGDSSKTPQIKVQLVSLEDHINEHTSRLGADQKPAVEWWASTYPALRDGECLVDDPTLCKLLDKVGVKATPMEDTVKNMLGSSSV